MKSSRKKPFHGTGGVWCALLAGIAVIFSPGFGQGQARECGFAPSTGENRTLVILANFANTVPTYSRTDFENKLFGPGPESVKTYWDQASYGLFQFGGDVTGWVTVSQPHDFYSKNDYGQGGAPSYPNNAQRLAEEAVDLAEAAGVDFSQYDNDGDGCVDSLLIVHQGRPGEKTGIRSNIWSFMGAISAGGGQARFYDGVCVDAFAVLPEVSYTGNRIVEAGPVAHEFGHLLGLRDLYDKDNSSRGIGLYDLMSAGVWGGDLETPDLPVYPSPVSKIQLGWLSPVLAGGSTVGTFSLARAADYPETVKIPAGRENKREYYLIANSGGSGADSLMPGEGLLIFHVDERGVLENRHELAGCGYHVPFVAVEQADGAHDLESNLNWGDSADFYPLPGGGAREFTHGTIPSAVSHDCRLTGVAVTNISDAGEVMSFDLTGSDPAPASPSPWLILAGTDLIEASGDGDGFPEAGEVFYPRFRLLNLGAPATNLRAVIGPARPEIGLGDTVIFFPDLAAGDSASGLNLVEITLSSAIRERRNYPLAIHAVYDGSSVDLIYNLVPGRPDTLYVDDDGGDYTERIIAYTLANYGFTFDYWDTASQGAPSAATLAGYQRALWVTGAVTDDPLNVSEIAALSAYLDGGGYLILNSPYLLAPSAPSHAVNFARDYLHVSSFSDDRYAADWVKGVNTADPISSYNFFVNYNLTYFRYPLLNRTIALTPDSTAAGFITNDRGNFSAVRYPKNPPELFRSAFLSFGLENVPENDLGEFLRRLMNFKVYHTGKPIVFHRNRSLFSPREIDAWVYVYGLNFYSNPLTVINEPDGDILIKEQIWEAFNRMKLRVTVRYDALSGWHDLVMTAADGSTIRAENIFRVEGAPGTNQFPVADAGSDYLLSHDLTMSLNAFASFDPDGDPITFKWRQMGGPPVTLQPSAESVNVYFDPDPLYVGDYLFGLTVSDPFDHSGDTVRVTATNSPPLALAGADFAEVHGSTVSLDGSMSMDPDNDPVTFKWRQLEGPPVAFDPSDTSPAVSFTLDPAYLGGYLFGLTVSDPWTESGDTVRITSFNNPPIASAGEDYSISHRLPMSLDATGSHDQDNDPITFKWHQLAGPPVVLLPSDTTETPSFEPDPAYVGDYLFGLTVSDPWDQAGDSVRITATNDPPLCQAGEDFSLPHGFSGGLSAACSLDPDGDPIGFKWRPISGPAISILPSDTAETVSFATDPAYLGGYLFGLTVSDPFAECGDTVRVTTTNLPPVANSGADYSSSHGLPMGLDARASGDPDGDPITCQWSLLSGPDVTLLPSHTAAYATFQPDPGYIGDYLFGLAVADPWEQSGDTVRITATNDPPLARAGDDYLTSYDHTLFLDASASSDPDLDPITFKWRQLSGPAVAVLPSDTAAAISFDPDPLFPGDYLFGLTVSDPWSESGDQIKVKTINHPPTADAGEDFSASHGNTIALDASGTTDPDNDETLLFFWRQISGPQVTIASPNSVTPTFQPDPYYIGDYLFGLTVSDTWDQSGDTVRVTAINNPPQAEAGSPQSAYRGVTMTLHGSSSADPDHDPLDYMWFQVYGPTAALQPSSLDPDPSFLPSPTFAGRYTFFLLVSDPWGANSGDTVSVTILNHPPVPDAGIDHGATAGHLTCLDGSESHDPENDPLAFLWSQAGGTAVSLDLTDPARPCFIPPEAGQYLFNLAVADPWDQSASQDQAAISAHRPNSPPVADAGPDFVFDFYAPPPVELDGGLSYDADGDTLTYSWTMTSQPAGSAAVLAGDSTVHPSFIAGLPGEYRISLVVNDGKENSEPDEVAVTVDAVMSDPDGDGIPNWDDPDDDNDLMDDEWETAHGLDPLNPSDGSLEPGETTDPDEDGNPNLHEYFNESDPTLADAHTCDSGLSGCFFGDANRNFMFDPVDFMTTLDKTLGLAINTTGIHPPNGDNLDYDGDTFVGPGDLSTINDIILGLYSTPSGAYDTLTLLAPGASLTVPAGRVVEISSQVMNSGNGSGPPVPRAGAALIYEIVAGTARLLGGEASLSPRYPPENLSALNHPAQEWALTLSADELEIVFSSNRPEGAGGYDLYYASRADKNQPFNPPALLSSLCTTTAETGPSLSADGLTLYFTRGNPATYWDLYQASRTGRASPFGEATALTELNTSGYEGEPSISPDGLTIYFSRYVAGRDWEIYSAQRADTSSPFGPAAALSVLNSFYGDRMPSIANEGKRIYFASNRPGSRAGFNLWSAERASVSDPFGAPKEARWINSDLDDYGAWESPDGLRLYISTFAHHPEIDLDLFLLRRPTNRLPFWISTSPARYSVTGTIAETARRDSAGRAPITLAPLSCGDVYLAAYMEKDPLRDFPALSLDGLIHVKFTCP